MALKSYQDWVKNFYSTAPKAPPVYQYTPIRKQQDLTDVQQEFKPFLYDQPTALANRQYGQQYGVAQNQYSRNNLWGSASGQGPQSSIRNAGLGNIKFNQGQALSAIDRAYQEQVTQEAQNRQNQSYDVYKKTVFDPWQQQYNQWLAGIGAYNQYLGQNG